MNLLSWLSQHAIPFTLILAYVPLIATIVTTVVSLVLARATVRDTESSDPGAWRSHVSSSSAEWAPELHLKNGAPFQS